MKSTRDFGVCQSLCNHEVTILYIDFSATKELTSHGDYDYYEIEECKGNKTAARMFILNP